MQSFVGKSHLVNERVFMYLEPVLLHEVVS
jgi:hypothetical protein